MTGKLSKPIAKMEHTWRALALVFFALICGEAWYIHQLSDQLIRAREEQSKALERHLSDQYQISTLKRAAEARAAQPQPELQPEPGSEPTP